MGYARRVQVGDGQLTGRRAEDGCSCKINVVGGGELDFGTGEELARYMNRAPLKTRGTGS